MGTFRQDHVVRGGAKLNLISEKIETLLAR